MSKTRMWPSTPILIGWLGITAVIHAPAVALDFKEVKQRGSLRVLAMDAQPEFLAVHPSAAPGFDGELLQGFASLHRVKLEVIEVPAWSALIPWLLDGKGDLIAGSVTDTEARRQVINFTHEVFPTRTVALTYKPHAVVTTVDELRRERIGTVKQSYFVDLLVSLKVPPANLDDSLAPGKMTDALRAGKVTAVLIGLEEAILAQRKDPGFQIGLYLGAPVSVAYGARKSDPELLKALDEYIENFKKSGSWSRLVIKYFGEAAPDILKKARTQ